MTASEMHISFKQGLDKFDSRNYPNLEPEEIDLLLNQAQDTFVKQRYGLNNVSKKSFEESQKRIEDINNLIKNQILNPIANNPLLNINTNANFVTLPADHWITVQELCNVTYPDCNGDNITENVYVQPLQHNDYSKIINNPFAKPTDTKVLRMVTEDGVELLHSSTSSINNYRVRYIKKPQRIDVVNTPNVDCELADITHQEIINIAISIALENIEAQRIKTFIQVTENRQE
jgi:hypothetical protein